MQKNNRSITFTLLTSLIVLTTAALGLIVFPSFTAAQGIGEASQDGRSAPLAPNGTITFDINATPTAIDTHVLGTNLPAWLGPSRTENGTFIGRSQAAAPAVLRIPGGSWSNTYDWLACETGTNIDGEAACSSWGWGLSPTDFINFANAIGGEVMYTVNMNGTAKEAAALVAFFNGSVNDNTVIGQDVRGRDWGTVSDWAQLRSSHGNPNPLNVKYWEIGNEIYGGKSGMGKDCISWGWEDVWTCDGREYVNGIGSGSNQREGFIEFRNAMRVVDDSIMVGAIGVPDPASWTNWGNEVIEEAGDVMDFYVIHEYAYYEPPSSRTEALAQPHGAWETIMADYETAYNQFFPGQNPPPIAVTEHNLFSVQDMDNGQWMTQGVNLLFMADSLGQMMQHGFSIATQWDLANGAAGNGTDYGWLDAYTYDRSPQYYAYPLWSGFGDQMLPVSSSYDAATTLSVYAGKLDDTTVTVLAINKTGSSIATDIQIEGASWISGGTADVAQASSLSSTSVTFNGLSNPSDDLSNAQPTVLGSSDNPLAYTFAPYSVTLLRLDIVPGSRIEVDDVWVEEGDSGTTNAVFTVSLVPESLDTVTVDYYTVDDRATAGSDYTAVSDMLTFAPGETTHTVAVPVHGDTVFEAIETFKLHLSNATNGFISTPDGVGYIMDLEDASAWAYLPVVLKN